MNYPTAGTFQVTLIIGNGHEIDSVLFYISVTPTACLSTIINEVREKVNVFIFPNPASVSATISIEGVDLHKDTQFQLYNYLGQAVGMPILINENSFTVNIEAISSGGYYFNIIQDDSIIKTEKLLIINR